MSIITSSKARFTALGLAALAVGSVGTLLVSKSAEAIPTPQRSCATDTSYSVPNEGWSAVNSTVTINNGKVARKVVVNLNADLFVPTNNLVQVGYRVDKGPVKIIGASILAVNFELSNPTFARHSMVVLDVPAGKHLIQPYWRSIGTDQGPNQRARIGGRCLTAEAYTS
jgi:hypothetical protein